jgi:hypothetical protein
MTASPLRTRWRAVDAPQVGGLAPDTALDRGQEIRIVPTIERLRGVVDQRAPAGGKGEPERQRRIVHHEVPLERDAVTWATDPGAHPTPPKEQFDNESPRTPDARTGKGHRIELIAPRVAGGASTVWQAGSES